MILWIMLAIGLLIRGIAIYQMRKNNIWKVINPREFVRGGIYKYIRHPMYAGAILMASSLTQMSLHNIGFTILFTVFVVSFCVDRADREEELMIKFFGSQYLFYMKKTSMFIPFIL